MNRDDKIQWMAVWCARNSVALELDGEVGFGRPCVGIVAQGVYPDYEWHDETTWDRQDLNGEVWTPPNAYHKHPCVAVLGLGEEAEDQLYQWLQWFDANGFKVETGTPEGVELSKLSPIEFMLSKHMYVRMVKN